VQIGGPGYNAKIKSMEHFLKILAGLGLFFFGIKLLGSHLKKMTGPRFKALIAKAGATTLGAGIWGVISGFVTQSGRVMCFIMASFVSAELITVRKSLPIIFWANSGRALFALAVVFPVHFITLALVGVAGIGQSFEFSKKHQNLVGALFGIGLFLFGLDLIKGGANGFLAFPWFRNFLVSISGSYLLAFFIGTIVTFFSQSHVGITFIAIALTQSGVFDIFQTFMILYGTHLGSSLISYSLSFSFQGTSRQIVMSQVLYNVFGTIIFVGLFYAEIWFDLPLVKYLIEHLTADVGQQAAYVAIFFNLVTAGILSLFCDSFHALLEKRWPPTEHEALAKARYIDDHAASQSETAILLIEKEQLRLLKRLPIYTTKLRPDAEEAGNIDLEAYHAACKEISGKINTFLAEVLQGNVSVTNSESLLNLQNRQSLLEIIEEDVFQFCATFSRRTFAGKAGQLAGHILEALETALLTLIAGAETGDPMELRILGKMTADKGTVMEKIRKAYFSSEQALEVEERLLILSVSNLFERTMYSIGRFGSYLQQGLSRQEAGGAGVQEVSQ
jgi:phosphate:Na+ symporter